MNEENRMRRGEAKRERIYLSISTEQGEFVYTYKENWI